jgi:hypothetical protein
VGGNKQSQKGVNACGVKCEMTNIRGIIFEGHGRASGCVEIQKPQLVCKLKEKYGDAAPQIEAMHSGTLNFHLECPILIKKYDFEIEKFEWASGCKEAFFLLKAKIEFPGNPWITDKFDCLLYNATTSAYLGRPITQKVELLMPHVDRKKIFDCLITFEQPCQVSQMGLIIG